MFSWNGYDAYLVAMTAVLTGGAVGVLLWSAFRRPREQSLTPYQDLWLDVAIDYMDEADLLPDELTEIDFQRIDVVTDYIWDGDE